MSRTPALMLVVAATCAAQSATVSNAVGTVSSHINTVAPGMLATLAESAVGNPFNIVGGILGAVPAPEPTALITSILIRPAGATATIPVNILSTASGTATFIVPAGVPYGGAEVLWQTSGVYSSTNVTVAQNNFELAQTSPAGPVKGQVASPSGLLSDISLASPARPGQTVFLTGSGLGYGTQVSATVAGVPATVLYSGRNGIRPGYDQIQLQLPPAITDGCFVPLALTVGSGTAAATVNSSISVTSDSSACPHPFQLSAADLKTLDTGGSLAIAQIYMQSDLQAPLDSVASRAETTGFSTTTSKLASILTPTQPVTNGCVDLTATPGFAVGIAFRSGDFSSPPPPDPGSPLILRKGATTLTLPDTNGNYSLSLPVQTESSLANPAPSVLMPGQWTFSSPGSADLAAASFTFTLPAPLRLAGGAPLSLRRDQDQIISWNGSDFAPTARLGLFLSGRARNGSNPRSIACSAAASAGTITIPAALLTSFASPSLATLRAQIVPAFDSLPHTLLKTKKGDTLILYVTYSSSDARPVDFASP